MEHVVLLDETGHAIGSQDKHTVHTADTPLHLAFSCYIFDRHGRLLASRRALGKRTWPGIWTNSVCGHPAMGETMVAAVRRRAAFELGLQLDEVRLVLPRFQYRAELHGVVENEMCPVFHAVTDEQPDPDPSEVEATRWLPWETFLAETSAAESAFSPWCRQQVQQLQALGRLPMAWPEGDPAQLPPAAR